MNSDSSTVSPVAVHEWEAVGNDDLIPNFLVSILYDVYLI